jgi:putative heme-binding domain-containing protein
MGRPMHFPRSSAVLLLLLGGCSAVIPPNKPAPAPARPAVAAAAAPAPDMTSRLAGEFTAEELLPVINRSLRGGRDFPQGARLFEGLGCILCHQFGGEGGRVGPNLSAIGAHGSIGYIVDSIVEPSKEIATPDKYVRTVVTLSNGQTLSGKLISQTDDELILAENVFELNRVTTLKTEQIASVEDSPISFMPAGLINGIRVPELADLIAYLVSGGDPRHRMFQPAPVTGAPTKG